VQATGRRGLVCPRDLRRLALPESKQHLPSESLHHIIFESVF
jgi:hypothetical protein